MSSFVTPIPVAIRMTAPRRIAHDLSRTLDGVSAPVWLFDDRRTLVFANSACASWIGFPVVNLVGQTAVYQVSTDHAAAAALNRICPPPEAFAGARIRAMAYAIDDGELRRRWTDFAPLAIDDAFAVLAVSEVNDAVEDIAAPADDSQRLRDCVARFRAEHAARFRLDRLIGASAAIESVRNQVRAAIASRANSLISGPPGSGREHVARTIFYGSRREHEQLLPIDCRLVTEESLTSSFASLGARSRGSSATVLLVHLDALTDVTRSQLLQLMKSRLRDVRLLATCGPRAEITASQSTAERDLLAQIATITICLPALADRRPDIPLLAHVLLEEINALGEKQVRGLSADAIDELVAYNWPRNVEELSEYVSAAHRAAETTDIKPQDLPKRLQLAADASRRPRRQVESIVLDEFLAQIELELIQRAIRVAKGNKTRAARLLGLTRPRLYRRMVQLGLETPEPATTREPKPARQVEAAGDLPDFIEDLPFEVQPDE